MLGRYHDRDTACPRDRSWQLPRLATVKRAVGSAEGQDCRRAVGSPVVVEKSMSIWRKVKTVGGSDNLCKTVLQPNLPTHLYVVTKNCISF